MSRRESGTLAVASTSLGPWKTAAAVGAVGGAAALGIDLISLHWSLSILAGPAGIGLFLFFLVGGAGSVLTKKGGDRRLRRWAAEHPWQTAAVPAAGLFVTNTLTEYFLSTSSGVFSSIFTALWHAIILFGIVGVVGAVAGSRNRG
ncbi:hypothetical protein ACFQZC_21585 [Streptacidiphilus monticola]